MRSRNSFILIVACLLAVLRAEAAPHLNPITSSQLKTKLAKTSAKATVVNLWATWCPPCREEMPDLVDLNKRYAPHGVQLILISGDSPDDLKTASEFLGRAKVTFAVYRLDEPVDRFMKPFIAGWSASLPTTMAFDKNGKRIGTWVGRVPIRDLEKKLTAALGLRAPPRLASPKKIGSD